jgi:hypothetical protein
MLDNGKRRAGSKGDGLCNLPIDAANIHFSDLRLCRRCQFAPPFVRREFVIVDRSTNGSTDRFRNFATRESLHTAGEEDPVKVSFLLVFYPVIGVYLCSSSAPALRHSRRLVTYAPLVMGLTARRVSRSPLRSINRS